MSTVEGEQIAGRYRVERSLGEGGMGSVVLVIDEATGNRVALKRPAAATEGRNHDQLVAMFKQEYHVLAQLAHPAVIQVHDFGFDGETPFYTMELLADADLRSRVPLAWPSVCDLLLELCEALSVLHARRLVHRDLSPRNVCFTADGRIKLIDFGALGSMGAIYPAVGTPPYVAPEALQSAPLGARVDIYALGALAYYALTGRHAYPARTFAELDELWRRPLPELPAELAVPQALQTLVWSMLSTEPAARPVDVAEVLQRAGALIGRTSTSAATQTQAFLLTPSLIGRQSVLERCERLLKRTSHGRGASCVVRGASGSGRSRVLQALATQAKLQGHLTAHIRCDPGQSDFASLRALFACLQATNPMRLQAASEDLEVALAPVLATPDARGEARRSLSGASATALHRGAVQCLARLSQMQPLTLVIDDIERCDAASIRVLAQLALEAEGHRWLIAFSTLADANAGAPAAAAPHHVLLECSQRIDIAPLNEEETQQLLASVFGEVPYLARLAAWVHSVASGLPRACLELAQHLVDRGIVTYTEGQFRLPMSLDGLQLPQNVQQLWDLRCAELSAAARAILALSSLIQPRGELDIAELLRALAPELSDEQVFGGLDELARAGLLLSSEGKYVCPHPTLLQRIARELPASRVVDGHARLARAYLARGDELANRTGYHLWHAGQPDDAHAALSRARAWFVRGLDARDDNRFFSRLDSLVDVSEALYKRALATGVSPARLHPARKSLLQFASYLRPELSCYARETMEQLRLDAGLDLWDSLDPSLDEMARLVRCLEHAQARHAAQPESERGLHAAKAIHEIASCAASLGGVYATTYDVQGVSDNRALMRPLRVLAPALDLVAELTQAAYESLVLGGLVNHRHERLLQVLQNPVDGIDELTRTGALYVIRYYVAMEHAGQGNNEALPYADLLEKAPTYEVLALQVRRMHALARGRYAAAQKYRTRREQLVLQNEASDQHLHMGALRELTAAYLGHDFLELTRTVSTLRTRAERFAGWRPWLRLGELLQRVMAGEFETARDGLTALAAELPPFSHGAWPHVISALGEVLCELGEPAVARELARQVLDGGVARGIVVDRAAELHARIALCTAQLGDLETGRRELDELLERLRPTQQGTVSFGTLCEARALMAVLEDDRATVEALLAEIRGIYCGERHPGLRARFERFALRARQRWVELTPQGSSVEVERLNTMLQAVLSTHGVHEQGKYLLSVVLTETVADSGCLYRLDAQHRPALVAAQNADFAGGSLLVQLVGLLSEQHLMDVTATADATDAPSTVTSTFTDQYGRTYAHRWLHDVDGSGDAIGIVLVACQPSQLYALPAAFMQGLARAVRGLTAQPAARSASS